MADMTIIKLVFFTPMTLFCIGVAGMIVAHFTKKQKVYDICKCLVAWLTFFFLFPYLAKKAGLIKNAFVRWIIAFMAPPMLVFYAMVYGFSSLGPHAPEVARYHDAADLQKATGVEFPEVTLVDSISYEGITGYMEVEKFVPVKPLTKSFFKRLNKACIEDSCCWRKDEDGYHYYILNECTSEPFDRTKGMHSRKVDNENDWEYDGGPFIEVKLEAPLKGDTITITYGWGK